MSGAILKITDAGRAALVNAQNNGTLPVLIAKVGISNAAFVPAANLVALPNQLKQLDTIAGEIPAADTMHVTIRDDSADQYEMFGFGLYLDNGVLFGTYGQSTPITEKSPVALLLLAVDVRFVDIDTAALTFGNADFTNPPATETRQGVIEIATQVETDAGVDDSRAVTPKKLAARIGTREPSILAGTTSKFWRGDKTWQDLFTQVRGATLTGLSTATNAVIAAGDTVLGALGKLQAQITALSSNKQDSISAGTTSQYWRGDKTWQDLFSQVRAATLAGLSTATNAAISTSDTVLSAFGKLQKQITDLTAAVNGKEASITAGTTSKFWRGDKTWQDLFTQVRAATLAGLSTATNAAISTSDTVLSALGKLQKQITDLTSRSISAGNGLSGGGSLSASRTITLGTPGTLSGSTGNSVSTTSHTHAISSASTTVEGVIELATDAEARSLTDTVRALTPATLVSAFNGTSVSLNANGYQRLPSGLIIQWGQITSGTSVQTSFTFPIAFPNNCYHVFFTDHAGQAETAQVVALKSDTKTLTGATAITPGSAGFGVASFVAIGN